MAEINSISDNNKRIAKNTIILYIRMLVMLVVSFFTTRITLEALGVEDYGVYNVVGGLVSMFSMISNSLTSSVGRFITFGLGKGDLEYLKRIFSLSLNIHILLAIIVIILIETFGVWFFYNKLVIPEARMDAATWVLHCSVISFGLGLLAVPYNATIVAHEKMSAFAYLTIYDVVIRLLIVLGIYFYQGDKLILYAVLNLVPVTSSQLLYWIYSKRHFKECVYSFSWDKSLAKNMFGFAGWNFIGCTAALMKDQGVNIAINMFTGPIVNAARGIAMQINVVITRFISNFTIALNPQIIKEYAAGNLLRMHTLIFEGTRLSYFIFMVLSIPVFFEIDMILKLWLGIVPEHTILFTRLVLILSLIEILSYSLIPAQNATGNIRNYQIVVGGIMLLNFPISYVLLYLGNEPEVTLVVAIFLALSCLIARLLFLRRSIKLPMYAFIKYVCLNVFMVTLLSSIIPYLIFSYLDAGIGRLLLVFISSVCASLFFIYTVGCNSKEKNVINQLIYKILYRVRR